MWRVSSVLYMSTTTISSTQGLIDPKASVSVAAALRVFMTAEIVMVRVYGGLRRDHRVTAVAIEHPPSKAEGAQRELVRRPIHLRAVFFVMCVVKDDAPAWPQQPRDNRHPSLSDPAARDVMEDHIERRSRLPLNRLPSDKTVNGQVVCSEEVLSRAKPIL
jgi:hypothetical protein